MKKSTAIKTYFKHSRRSRGVLKKLMKWNEGATIEQNAEALGKSAILAYSVAKRFKLSFAEGERKRRPLIVSMKSQLKPLVEAGFSRQAISRLYRTTPVKIQEMAKKQKVMFR